MVRFILNGAQAQAAEGRTLLSWLREEARFTGAKNACGEGTCGACSVVLDGALRSSCILPIERVEGRTVLTVAGIPEREMTVYVRAFAEAGAVQCGFCTPGMVLAAKVLLDRSPDPTPTEVRAGLKRNLCRCTGYAKIVDAILLAARYRRGEDSPAMRTFGVGARMPRVDAEPKIRGTALFVDDMTEPGMLHGAVLRSPHPRARLLSLDVKRRQDNRLRREFRHLETRSCFRQDQRS